jgi:CheY-like chemotaxis protein
MPSSAACVLLVDDHQDTLEMYATFLQMRGFDVLCASSAEQGVCIACTDQPDVVVVDGRLPDRSGSDLIQQLKSHPRCGNAGFLMLTGDDKARQEAMAAGCDRFLLKPCIPDALALEISELVASRRLVGAVHGGLV